MKFKNFGKSFLSMLLIVAMLISACAIFAACGGDDGDHDHGGDAPSGDTPPLSDCQHTVTTKKNQRAATCAEAGYTGDDVCSACGAVVKSGESIAVLAHTWNAGEITKDPTCIEQGVKTITCTACLITKTESVPTVAHQDKYHDALDGTHAHTCTTCTMSEYKEHVPTDAGTAYPATCLVDAYVEYTCSLCKGVYRVYSTTDKATGHSWGEWESVAATCCEAGSKTRVCTACETPETIVIPVAADAHNYVELTERRVVATCSAVGTIYYQCTLCEGTSTKEIPINHNAHQLSAPVIKGSFELQECALCEFEVSKLVANSTNASVNASEIEADRAFEVATTDANVQFPKDVVSQLTGDKSASVEINAGVADDKESILQNAQNLTDEQKQRLSAEGVDIYDFSVKVGGTTLSQFDSSITVVLPYELQEGEDPDGIVIWYVAPNGDVEKYDAIYENGFVTFRTEHFSYYAIAYEETQESKCRRGIHRWMDDPFVQEVSCAQLGYTVYECDTCHTVDIQNIQERLEHAYGDLEHPTVTCTEGGYIKQTCSLCQHSIELQYVRAKGHTVTKVATCTEGVYCEDCKDLVTPATGHNWSDWVTVVEPTETANGLRRRNCPKCGTVEEAKIAYTGSIQKLNFNSYEDILNFLVKDVLNMENGKITLDVESSEYFGAAADMQIDFTISKAGESYEMLIDYNYVEEDGEYTQFAQLLYRNGIAVALQGKDALGDKDIATLTGDVFGYYFAMPFEAYGKYWELVFDTFAPVYEPVLEEIGPLFDVMDALLADVIDDADLYTPGELANAFLKIRNTYAYWAYKMDAMTSLSYDSTIEVVTRQDVLDTLSYFMTVTEDATGKHYTWDATKLMDSIDAVLAWLEENEETTMDEVIWMLIGEQVTAKFPEIESFEDLIAALTEALPGTTPIQDVIDDVITFIDSKKEGATASLYAMVDAIALIFMAGGEFDSEEFLLSFGEEGTLNDLAAMCFGDEEATVEMLFQMVDQMMKEQTVGGMMVPYYLIRAEKTISELLPTVRETFDRILLDVDLAFTLDQSGKLVSLTNSNEGKYVIGETGNQQTVLLTTIDMTITCNDSIKVQIPAALQDVADDKVTATFDEAGQLVVKVPTGYDLDFRLRSSGLHPSMDYVLEKNADMSGEMGFDVYVVKPQFASGNNGYTNVYHLYEVNGVYYQSIGFGGGSKYSYTKICTISELQSNIASLVQREKYGEEFYINMNGEEGIAYEARMLNSTYWFVELNGELYLKKNSRHSYSDYDTYTESTWDPVQFQYVRKEYVRFYDDYTLVALEDIFSDVQVSSMSSYSTAPIDGVKRDLWNVYLALDIETWGTDTLEATCYIDSNDNLVLCQEVYQSDHKIYLYPLDVAPAGKLVDRYEVRSENYYYASTQTKVEDTIYQVEIESAVTVENPVTCYAKMANGMYVNVEYLVSNPAIRHITDTVTLSDGTQMYVIGERNMPGKFGSMEYDGYCFGYVKVMDGAYTEAVAYCAGEQVIGERYRYARDTYSDMYGFDVSYYMTKMDDTTYVFAAELFTFLQDMCEDAGDMYAIVVDGDKQIGDDYYTLYAYATMYMEPLNSISLGRGESADMNLNWDEMFRGISTNPSFRIMQENKDTVSIYCDTGSTVEVYEYQLNNRYPANSYMVRDDAKSNEYGLEIYRYSFPYLQNETTYYYVLKDGKYYGYWYDDVYDLTLSNSLTDLFKDNWSLENIYYYYDLRDPAITGGTDLRVYKAMLCFNNTYEGYIPVYVTVKNGKLMALTGAVEMGDSVLKFEDLKPFSAYVQMLTSSAQEVSGRDSYKDGNFRYAGDSKLYQVTYTYVELTETDATGKIKTHTLRVQIFEQNGVKKYVKEAKYLGHYMNIEDQPATLPAYDRMTQKTEVYFNGTFTIAALTQIREHLDYAVKLAGKFYDLDTYVHYYGPRLNEEAFREAMSTKDWFYFIYDDNGNRVFYNKLEDGYDKWDNYYGVLSEPVDAATANALIQEGDINDIGIRDKDGNWIYEVSAYLPTDWELVREPQGDGTFFYHHKGMTKGYLKDQDGMYVRASKIVAGDGNTYILCHTEIVSINDQYLQELGAFKNEIVFNQNGTIVTISKDLLTWIEQNGLQNYFTVTFSSQDSYSGERYTVSLTYYDLVAWFKLAQAGGLVPGEVGDPTLPTESNWW